MSQASAISGGGGADPQDEVLEGPRKLPSLAGLFHFLWLRKWAALAVWLLIAIPVGVLLSIFDLPKSYTSFTVLRFPAVVGASTNVMRDVAITQGESIISIFNSYQVLESTVRRLGLRMRITTPHVFKKDCFKELTYTDALAEGTYVLKPEGGRRVTLTYQPLENRASPYVLYAGVPQNGKIAVAGLHIELAPSFYVASGGEEVEMRMKRTEETIAELKKGMAAKALGPSNFQLSVKDRDPYLVADIVNVLREQFLEVYYGTTEVQDVGILVQMEKDLELAKQRLDKSQDDLAKYFAAHPELSAQEGPSRQDNLGHLEARQAIETIQQRRSRVQTAMAAKDMSAEGERKFYWANELLQAMSEAGEPKANILRASLGELNGRLLAHRQTLGPEHPKILEVEKEKAEIYRQMEEAQAELMRRLDRELSDAKVRFAATAPSNAPQVPVKVKLELERLNAVNQNSQSIYDRLQESYNRAKLVTGSEFFKVTVVDPGRPALYVPPSLQTRLLIAAAAVFLLALLIPAAFLAWPIVFVRIWTKPDVVRLLGLRCLGTVPLRRLRRSGKEGKAGGAEAQAAPEERPAGAQGNFDPLLLYLGKTYRLEDVEAFRILREEAENSFRGKVPGKYCLMVTSCHPHEGKSTCAANMAMAFARKGKRTLLVDADFRLGRQHQIFALQVHTGIDDFLGQQDLTMEQFLESAPLAFLPTAQRNLVVAPRKQPNSNAGELVSSDRFKEFVRMVRQEFDVVIIDTPPVLITPEPLSVAELVDGVIFVCRSGVTAASEAREAIDTLKDRGVRMSVILNGMRDTFFDRSRFRKYSYYYQVQPKPTATVGE